MRPVKKGEKVRLGDDSHQDAVRVDHEHLMDCAARKYRQEGFDWGVQSYGLDIWIGQLTDWSQAASKQFCAPDQPQHPTVLIDDRRRAQIMFP